MISLHGVHDAYQNLDRLDDQWTKLGELVDFETFRESLEAYWWNPGDAVMTFKISLTSVKKGATDGKLECMVTDSLTLTRLLCLDMEAMAQDRTTIARYRSLLDASGVRDAFHEQLKAVRYRAQSGQMLDSTFALAPIQ